MSGDCNGSVKLTELNNSTAIVVSVPVDSARTLVIFNNGLYLYELNKRNQEIKIEHNFDYDAPLYTLLLDKDDECICIGGLNGKASKNKLMADYFDYKIKEEKTKEELPDNSDNEETEVNDEIIVEKTEEIEIIADMPEVTADITLDTTDCDREDEITEIIAAHDVDLKEIVISTDKAEGNFFDNIQDQLEVIFELYPHHVELENLVNDSRWVTINYDNVSYYVVGEIFDDNKPVFICYGVPMMKKSTPPEDIAKACEWLPLDKNEPHGKGFYMLYQNAETGEIIN